MVIPRAKLHRVRLVRLSSGGLALVLALLAIALVSCSGAALRTEAATPAKVGLQRLDEPVFAAGALADAPLYFAVSLPESRALLGRYLDADDLDGDRATRFLLPPPAGASLAELGLPERAVMTLSVYPFATTPAFAERAAIVRSLLETPDAEDTGPLAALANTSFDGPIAGARLFVEASQPDEVVARLGREAERETVTVDGRDGFIVGSGDAELGAIVWLRGTEGGLLADVVFFAGHTFDERAQVEAELDALFALWDGLLGGAPALPPAAPGAVLHLAVEHDALATVLLFAGAWDRWAEPPPLDALAAFHRVAEIVNGPPGHPLVDHTFTVTGRPGGFRMAWRARFAEPDPGVPRRIAVPLPHLEPNSHAWTGRLNGHLLRRDAAAVADFLFTQSADQVSAAFQEWPVPAAFSLLWSAPSMAVTLAGIVKPLSHLVQTLPQSATLAGDLSLDRIWGVFVGDDVSASLWTSCVAMRDVSGSCGSLIMPAPEGPPAKHVRDQVELWYTLRPRDGRTLGSLAPTAADAASLAEVPLAVEPVWMDGCVDTSKLGEIMGDDELPKNTFTISLVTDAIGVLWEFDVTEPALDPSRACPVP